MAHLCTKVKNFSRSEYLKEDSKRTNGVIWSAWLMPLKVMRNIIIRYSVNDFLFVFRKLAKIRN